MGVDPKKESETTAFKSFLTNKKLLPSSRVDDLDHPFRVKSRAYSPFGKQAPGILLSGLNARLFSKGERISIATVNMYPDTRNPEIPRERSLDEYIVKRNLDVSGFYLSKFYEHNQYTAYVHINTAREMLGFDPLEEGFREVFNEVAIKLDDEAYAADVVKDLKQRLKDVLVNTPWNVITWEGRKRNLLKAVDHERALMKLLLGISLVVAGFLIFATLSMMVTEKTRDIGILTALGATRKGVLYVFLFCGFVISFIGSILGLIAGWLSALYVNDINEFLERAFNLNLFPRDIYNLSEIPTELDPVWMIKVIIGAVLLALLFSFLPAYRAARFEPVKALRYE